jgi:hypothetical protein
MRYFQLKTLWKSAKTHSHTNTHTKQIHNHTKRKTHRERGTKRHRQPHTLTHIHKPKKDRSSSNSRNADLIEQKKSNISNSKKITRQIAILEQA